MRLQQLDPIKRELTKFVNEFAPLFRHEKRTYWCGMYLTGLILDGERKSIEPLSKRIPGGNEQALQQFVNQSPWQHTYVMQKAWKLMMSRLKPKKGILVLDDTTFPKKGECSVGVSHQYCGALGKFANCQSVVTWQFVCEHGHLPLVGQMYLPQTWTDDKARMEKSGVPSDCQIFKEKWKIALDLLDDVRHEVRHDLLLCDAGYGGVKEFLHELSLRGEKYFAQIPESHSFWPADIELKTGQNKVGRRRVYAHVTNDAGKPLRAHQWLENLLNKKHKNDWHRIVLPLQKRKIVHACAIRVCEVRNYLPGRHSFPGEELWLIMERHRDGKLKYYVSNLDATSSLKKLIFNAHERWNVEQSYQQLKEELGLDHFEGRSWRGFHHHLTLTFMAYDFLMLIKHKKRKKNQPDNSSSQVLDQPAIADLPLSLLRSRAKRGTTTSL